MNNLLHELPSNIREYIDCIMDDVIIFTPDVKTHKKVLKSFMLMLKKYDMLLTINKVYTFRWKVKYMGLLVSSNDNLPIKTPLSSRVKAISTLPIAQGIKSFIGCVIYLAQFLPKLSELIKPINDILKIATRSILLTIFNPCFYMPKAKAKAEAENIHLIFKSIGCLFIQLTLRL